MSTPTKTRAAETKRLAAIIKKAGTPTYFDDITGSREELAVAMAEGRAATIYHPEEGDGPFWAEMGRGYTNRVALMVFPQKPDVAPNQRIIGIMAWLADQTVGGSNG